MTGATKEPLSSPVSFQDEKKGELSKSNGKSVRQEPRSDPTGTKPCPGDLDSLSEEQLRKLTKANTKKNHGGRSSRLRSQVERVFRRLDNLAADVKLQPRYSMDALPIVSPRNPVVSHQQECHQDTERKENITAGIPSSLKQPSDFEPSKIPEGRLSDGAEPKLDQIIFENEEFEIEPATNNSAFTDSSNSLGVRSGSVRSVRISSSVTILDYTAAEPVSVGRMQIFEHPTRTGQCLQIRKHLADEMKFPHVLQKFDQNREGENQVISDEIPRRGRVRNSMSRSTKSGSPSLPRRVQSAGPTPNAYVLSLPSGPYGPRSSLR